MFTGADLLALQSIDRETAAGKRRFLEIEKLLSEDGSLVRARQRLGSAERVTQKGRARQKDLELEIQGLSNKASSSETRLYGGTVTNPKELSDLQAEIAGLKRRRQSLEDDLLDAMISVEEAETEQNESRTDLDEKEQAWVANQEHFRAEYKKLTAHIEKLSGEREKLIPRVGQHVLGVYTELWKRKTSLPIAEAKAGACGVCGVILSAGIQWKLRQGELVQCENCERILVRT